jgi:pyridoxal phosphate enzyme (YggS family)
MTPESDVAQNLIAIKDRIIAAAKLAHRNADEVTLVAVSKVQPAARILPALKAGHKTYGENRVQEAEDKWPALITDYPDTELHLIGPLQRNKVKRAVQLFDVIETIDRLKLARAVAREIEEQKKRLDCYIQINTGEEPQKAGILSADADVFIRQCIEELGLPVVGLMCIPPVDEEASLHFALLAKIAKRNGLKKLSMGMSSDFETAVRFGASSVRVGTAIFGDRTPQA